MKKWLFAAAMMCGTLAGAQTPYGATPVLMFDSAGNPFPNGSGATPSYPVNQKFVCYTNISGQPQPCDFAAAGQGDISGTVTATHLTMGSAPFTITDSPATFDGTTFTFANPFTVQAHSAFGVGSAVDSGNWQNDLGGPAAAIANFMETSTTAAGVSGGVFDVTWNPTVTNSTSAPFALGSSLNVNMDGQSGTSAAPIGFVMNFASNGNTTALASLTGGYNGVFLYGTAPVTGNAIAWYDDFENDGAATIGNMIDRNVLESNAGSVGEMKGDNVALTNTGTAAGIIGSQNLAINSGTVTGDVDGFVSLLQLTGTVAQHTSFVGSIDISAGSIGNGYTNFGCDGADSSITVATSGAIPNYHCLDFVEPAAAAHVITNEIALSLGNVTHADNNFEIVSGTAPSTFAGPMKFSGLSGVGTAGVTCIDASGNLSACSAPTISAANMTSFPTFNQSTSGNAATATNLAGGAIGRLPYQSAASTTLFVTGNTAATDQVLTSTGTGSAAQAPTLKNAPALSAANMTGFPATLATAISIPTGTATFAGGTGITSVACASGYSCNNTRGTLTIVAAVGATTGTIATVSFSATLSAAPACFAYENGGSTNFGIGNSAPTASAFNITAGISVSLATLTVNYTCQP